MIGKAEALQQVERLSGLNFYPHDKPAALRELVSAMQCADSFEHARKVAGEMAQAWPKCPMPADVRTLISMVSEIDAGVPVTVNGLPGPCEKCAGDGYWMHLVRHSTFGGTNTRYEMAGRCTCPRGRRLFAMDCERAANPKTAPSVSHSDREAEDTAFSRKMARWKREREEELSLGADEARRRRWERNECPGEIQADKQGRIEAGLSND